MIVQRVRSGDTPVIIRNVDHAVTAATFARHFGNGLFRRPSSIAWPLMQNVVANHEEGWRALDDAPEFNPETGLPYHLAKTPMPLLLQKTQASPAFNEAIHPWCGLLASMHCWGLFHDRYGLSDKISITARAPEHRKEMEHVLAAEIGRQERLKARLLRNARTASSASPAALMTAYKLLEFFDTLALHFQLADDGTRESASFQNVPAGDGIGDLIVQAEMIAPTVAKLAPYPFDEDPLVVHCRARRVTQSATRQELIGQLKGAQVFTQQYTVTAAA